MKVLVGSQKPLILPTSPFTVLAIAWITGLAKGPRQLCHLIGKCHSLDCLCSVIEKGMVLYEDMEPLGRPVMSEPP